MSREHLSEQQQNIQFVKEVEKHPCLYNFELSTYARKDVTDQAWDEVSRASNMTASACRERWRNIRAVFMRTVKGQGKRKPYYLAEVMEFIRPFMRPLLKTYQHKLVNYTEYEDDETLDIDVTPIKVERILEEVDQDSFNEETYVNKRSLSISEECIPKKKVEVSPVIQSSTCLPSTSLMPPSTEATDHIKSFVDSLMPELTEMNAAQFKIFKRRVLVLIDDITTNTPIAKHSDEEYIM